MITAAVSTSWGAPPPLDDNPLNPPNAEKTTVKAIHITQLRTAINALRSHLGMSNYAWITSATTSDLISADPILEMRIALDQALGTPSPSYAAGLAQHQSILAVHIQELRNRVMAAWNSNTGGTDVRWLVTDQLGTPRMIFDQTGNFSSVSRYDYLPFGEELFAGGRTSNNGYPSYNTTRQKFTGYERDDEVKLDFAQARYYSNNQGRFTGPDPLMASADLFEPQSWNRYSYVINNPLIYTDPLGLAYNMGGGTAEMNSQDPQQAPNIGDLLTLPRSEFGVEIINTDLDNKTGKYLSEGEVAAKKIRNFMGLSLADEFDNRASAGNDRAINGALNIAGTIGGLGSNYMYTKGVFWRDLNGVANTKMFGQGPNQFTGPRSIAIQKSGGLGVLGKALGVAGMGMSLVHGGRALYHGDNAIAAKDGLDTVMGGVGTFGGPYCAIGAGCYFAVDMTIGWPKFGDTAAKHHVFTTPPMLLLGK